MRRNHSLWETLAGTLGTVEVTVLASGEDVRAAEREQWDDSNNYLAVASGVVIGYERNVAPTPCCASTGSRSPPWRARNSAAAGADPLHDLSHRARPCLAGSAQRASRVIPPRSRQATLGVLLLRSRRVAQADGDLSRLRRPAVKSATGAWLRPRAQAQ